MKASKDLEITPLEGLTEMLNKPWSGAGFEDCAIIAKKILTEKNCLTASELLTFMVRLTQDLGLQVLKYVIVSEIQNQLILVDLFAQLYPSKNKNQVLGSDSNDSLTLLFTKWSKENAASC